MTEEQDDLDTGDAAHYGQLSTYCCRSNRDNFGTGCSLQTAFHRHAVETADKQDNLETTYAVLYIQLR